MTNILSYILALFFLTLLSVEAQVEVKTYGNIPANRIPANGWEHFEWDSTGDWTIIDVSDHGIIPNSSTDIAPLVTAIINGGSGKRILKFPAGTYQVKSGMNISKSDIQIIGEGSTTRFILQGGDNPGSIFGNGGRTGNYKLAQDAARGDNTATFVSANAFNIGDYFICYQAGDITRSGASGDETQIFKVTAKSGNTLTLDMKFGIPFYAASTRIEKINYKKNLRFSNFYMEMATKPTAGKSNNLSLNTVQNVEISNIESNKALNTHVTIYRGREVVCHNNNFYGNYGGGGGFQYGFSFCFCTNCHIINNIASNMRHFYSTQFGTNHCVIAYNKALPPYNGYGDITEHNSKGCHNNLFEGNYGSEIFDDPNPLKSWGTRYSMWFRNHATSKIGSENAYVEHINIIGNELETGISGIKTGNPGKDIFAGANIVNMDEERGTGTMVWGKMSYGDVIPASLFLTDKPDYLDKWPLYGPPADVRPRSKLRIKLVNPDTNYLSLEPEYTLKIEAQVSDEDLLDSLSLYMNGTFIRSIKSSPFVWLKEESPNTDTINNLPIGLNAFTLEALDTTGAISTTRLVVLIKESYTPFSGEPSQIPGIIEAENYNNGGESIAYHDHDSGNLLGIYRSDDVDIAQGPSDSYIVNNIYAGEWLQYTTNIISSGYYTFQFTYASRRLGGKIGAQNMTGDSVLFSNLAIPLTRGWNDFQNLTKDSIWLPAGILDLRINFEKEGYNLDKITITSVNSTQINTILNNSIMIYPVPNSNGIFHINSMVNWKIYALTGIILKKGYGNIINISDEPRGIYLFKCEEYIKRVQF